MDRTELRRLKIHLRYTHKNLAAHELDEAEAIEQHYYEHFGPGGLRNHEDPADLHPPQPPRLDPSMLRRIAEIVKDIDGRRERYADARFVLPRATLDMLPMLPGRVTENHTRAVKWDWVTGIPVYLDESMPPGSWRVLDREGREIERGGFPPTPLEQIGEALGLPAPHVATAGDLLEVARAMRRDLRSTTGRLGRIAEAHSKHVDRHGGTTGDCNECGYTWPCPTYVWATTERDPATALWDPDENEETPK